MKLYEHRDAWLLTRRAQPSVTLRAGVSRELATIPYLRELFKLKARSLVHRTQTRRWLALLNSHPTFSDLVRNYPRMLYKIYRPYLSNVLPVAARLSVLESHYRFVFDRGLGPTITQASRAKVLIGSIIGKNGALYAIDLRAVGPLEREGELVLQLSAGDALIYSIAFTFTHLDGVAAVSVGCLQGAKTDHALTSIREVTRELHGLRPKQLMVTLVRQLGFQLGCTQLRLVGNANRVVRGAMRQGRVYSNYDQLWSDLGAFQQPDGDFQMSCEPLQQPDMEWIPSKKRSEARKRHDMLAGLVESLTGNLRIAGPERPSCG